MPSSPTRLNRLTEPLFVRKGRQSHVLLQQLRVHWADIVSAQFARRCFPLRMRGNTLWIGSENAGWAHELHFHRSTLLACIQAFLEPGPIRHLRFHVSERPQDTADGETAPSEAGVQCDEAGARSSPTQRGLARLRTAVQDPAGPAQTLPQTSATSPKHEALSKQTQSELQTRAQTRGAELRRSLLQQRELVRSPTPPKSRQH